MFQGGGSEQQFHQFLVSSRTTTTNTNLSFPLDHLHHHHHQNPSFNSTFDPSSLFPSSSSSSSSSQLQSNLHNHHFLHHSSKLDHHLHHQHQQQHQHHQDEQTNTVTTVVVDPWSTEEVLALLRIRSTSIDNWFSDFSWDHVSRKMEELGYKRSAHNCKEKYEEETSTNLNGIDKLNNKFMISEFEEQIFYQDHNPDENKKPIEEQEQEVEKMMNAKMQEEPTEKENIDLVELPNPSEQEQVVMVEPTKTKKRRSREDKFEMFKGFCIDIVHKMLAQQEDLHNKLIQDMVKRDEAKIERDEVWKKQEMDRVNKEIETREHEQIIVSDRQAKMIKLLNKFNPRELYPLGINLEEYLLTFTQPKSISLQTEKSTLVQPEPDTSKDIAKVCETPRKLSLNSSHKRKLDDIKCTPESREDIGRRWPKDEVQALIDMRCSFYNSNIKDEDNATNKSSGGSVWEKISLKMTELGYSRSSKRCKEKWENINKYFRKTKDSNKKRSIDSRTCPYFHQLSSLYNQTALPAPSDETDNHSNLPENPSALPETTI